MKTHEFIIGGPSTQATEKSAKKKQPIKKKQPGRKPPTRKQPTRKAPTHGKQGKTVIFYVSIMIIITDRGKHRPVLCRRSS